jgi:hypothetical protein
MIKSILFCSGFMLSGLLVAQKPKPKEKAPTQAEMQQMMNEVQKQLDNMSPEEKKMMDSQGIKIPDFNNIKKSVSGLSNAQLKQAFDDENRVVPLKDAKRIAGIAASPLTTASLPASLLSIHNKVKAQLPASAVSDGEELYQTLVVSYQSNMGNIAAGLWMAGRVPLALYIMGKACADDPANTDNINNYAAMLSMNEAEQLAVPLLNYLNKNFPRNSTILNNLGQAWFGLGDILKAEKYLDSAIRINTNHPQATFTKSFIEESKGNTAAAVQLVKKSMQHAYTQEKADRLLKFGENMKAGELSLPPKAKADLLNLGGFQPPAFPKSVDECIFLKPVWDAYRESLDEEAVKLKAQAKEALANAAEMQQQRINTDLAMVQASIQAGSPQGSLTVVPIYIHKGSLQLKEVTEVYERKMEAWAKKVTDYAHGAGLQLRQEYEKEMAQLREEDGEQTGEGRPNKDYCPKYKAASDKFLQAYNTSTESFYLERLQIVKPFLNDMTYYSMYTNWPEMFEVIKLESKTSWLGALKADAPNNFESIVDFVCTKAEEKKDSSSLAEFDDVACQYHSEMNMVVFKMKSDCSRMTTELDAKFVKLKLKQDSDKKTFADQFMSCTVQVKGVLGLGDKVKMGPMEAGLKAEAGVEFEFDRTGVKDVAIFAGVKGGVGIKNDNGKVKMGGAGAEGRISIMSGKVSGKGTGMLYMIK